MLLDYFVVMCLEIGCDLLIFLIMLQCLQLAAMPPSCDGHIPLEPQAKMKSWLVMLFYHWKRKAIYSYQYFFCKINMLAETSEVKTSVVALFSFEQIVFINKNYFQWTEHIFAMHVYDSHPSCPYQNLQNLVLLSEGLLCLLGLVILLLFFSCF